MGRVLVVLAVIVFFASTVWGATLTYNPETLSVLLNPGTETQVPLGITVADIGTEFYYYLWFMDPRLQLQPPLTWISAVPAARLVTVFSPTAATALRISVPADAVPGVYSANLFGNAQSSHRFAGRGSGLLLEVTVALPCLESPQFEITSFGPSLLWPPNHSIEEVTVAGRLLLAGGCSVLKFGYIIDDEYGIGTTTGEVIVDAAGEFSAVIPVEAWREGSDKDGRHYTITLFAEDEKGVTTYGPLNVLVPHDHRDLR